MTKLLSVVANKSERDGVGLVEKIEEKVSEFLKANKGAQASLDLAGTVIEEGINGVYGKTIVILNWEKISKKD